MKKEECKVWKLLKISVIQILREINFGESRNCKTAFFCQFWDTECR